MRPRLIVELGDFHGHVRAGQKEKVAFLVMKSSLHSIIASSPSAVRVIHSQGRYLSGTLCLERTA